MATNEILKRPFEIWSPDDMVNLRKSLLAEKVNTARLVSCIFWSLTKFQLGKINELLEKAITEAQQEGRLQGKPYEVRKIIMEDGLVMFTDMQEDKTPYVVAEVHTPVTEWTSASKLLELGGFLKEMVVAIISNAELNIEENFQAQTASFKPTEKEIPGIIAAINREMERAKKQEGLFDLTGRVRHIATFTTVWQHKYYFRTVMDQVDQIDKRKITFYKAMYLHNAGLERKRKATEDAAVARRMKLLDKIWFEPL